MPKNNVPDTKKNGSLLSFFDQFLKVDVEFFGVETSSHLNRDQNGFLELRKLVLMNCSETYAGLLTCHLTGSHLSKL